MLASKFFKKGRFYKYIGGNSLYFTKDKIYKSFGYEQGFSPGQGYNILQVNKGSTMAKKYIDGIETNGLGDGWFSRPITEYFQEVKNKSHLPKWW